jgi:CheY-like chemotaxis protein/anti-sigma regulatory factor (Ser/Thr protein kinase)
VAIELTPGQCRGRVLVDVTQLHQVLTNLLVNASQAMPEGGRIEISAAQVRLPESLGGSDHAPEQIRFAVEDSGPGVPEELRARIFEPFFTTKPTGQGTGLGLATIYGIVKQADGHVLVYSEVGRGSTFKVYLPALTKPVPATTHPVSPAEVLAGGTETILICEDDDTVRQLVAHMLRDVGYTILTAANGDDALRQSAQHNGAINLLITDVIMPDTNGKRLADALLQKRPDMKALFISGYTANIIAHHGVLDDNVEFLAKPFSRRALVRRVREVLDRTRSNNPRP